MAEFEDQNEGEDQYDEGGEDQYDGGEDQDDENFLEIEGNDTEELLAELLTMYADRELVLFHRAACSGDLERIVSILESHYEWIDKPLLPRVCFEEVRKSNGMDYESFSRFGLLKQVTPYPTVEQFETGDAAGPNELFPTGEYHEPETNLDTVFWTPLMRACYCGQAEVITLLSDFGANKNYQSPCHANCLTAILYSPILENQAAHIRLVATAENVNFHDYVSEALMNEDLSNVDIVRTLLEVGCTVDPNSDTYQGDWRSWIPEPVAELLAPYLDE